MALVQQKIGKLQVFINSNPALRTVPFAVVAGKSINPVQALAMLRSGQNTQAVINQLAKLGVDPPEDWPLAVAYYKDMLAKPGPHPKIYAIPKATGQVVGESMTIQEAIRHIEARDAIGLQLVESYRGLKVEMARRMR